MTFPWPSGSLPTLDQARAFLAALDLEDDFDLRVHAMRKVDRVAALCSWVLKGGSEEREPGDDDDEIKIGDVRAAYDRERAREASVRRAVTYKLAPRSDLDEFAVSIDDRVALLLSPAEPVGVDDVAFEVDADGMPTHEAAAHLGFLADDLADCRRRAWEEERKAASLKEQGDKERAFALNLHKAGKIKEAVRAREHLQVLALKHRKAVEDSRMWRAFAVEAEARFKAAGGQ